MARTTRNGDAPEHGGSGDRKARARAEARARARARWEREAERRIRLCYAVELGGQDHGLSPPEVQTLQAIAVGEQTWTPAEELARVGLNGATLAGLIAVGWVEEFVLQDGPAVTLSPWAAEALGVEPEERWEVLSGVVEQQDNSGEKTRSHVRQPHEVPRWATRPPPPEPGMPRPRRVPLKLPFLFRMSRLPDDVVHGLLARAVADPVEEAIEKEEFDLAMEKEKERRFVEQQARTEAGSLDVDPETGQVRMEPVLLFPTRAQDEDGLKGGLADPHGGKIPIAKPRGRRSKKKRRRRRRST